MKKTILGMALCALTAGAWASNSTHAEAEEVNYGDPTASFSTLGVSRTNNATQINGMYGAGSNIFQLDVTRADNGDLSGRGRYFHVTDGLGYSVDILGDKDTATVLGGMIYKFQVSDNVMLFPMLSAGVSKAKSTTRTDVVLDNRGEPTVKTTKYNNDDTLLQGGLYALYAFDAGHWLYANPKVTRTFNGKATIPQIEIGGGYMVTDSASVGFKVEHTGKFDTTSNGYRQAIAQDTVSWLQANYYF
ncbi:hypothetical protein JCM19239_4950 [Vibrio variabilis]|uniref:Outer membrane protein n=1 Tax=Vibrio variabilis TaxID=990271 RepID=A0ABQ0JBF2_9VIBR|nr:hypothetical protein JCM19239_4950 [Vibrio variabilis]